MTEKKTKTPDQEIALGKQAKLVLDDPAWKEAVAETEETFVQEWRSGETVEARETAYAGLKALSIVIKKLVNFHERSVGLVRRQEQQARLKGRTSVHK